MPKPVSKVITADGFEEEKYLIRLLDEFAGHALAGILGSPYSKDPDGIAIEGSCFMDDPERVARMAYEHALAMIRERESFHTVLRES